MSVWLEASEPPAFHHKAEWGLVVYLVAGQVIEGALKSCWWFGHLSSSIVSSQGVEPTGTHESLYPVPIDGQCGGACPPQPGRSRHQQVKSEGVSTLLSPPC